MGIYKRPLILILAIFLFIPVGMQAQKKKKKKSKKTAVAEPPKPLLSSNIDTISYALGMGVSKNLLTSGMDTVSMKAFEKGFLAVFNGDSTLINEDEVQMILSSYFQNLANKQLEKSLEEGKAFLEKNKLRPGVDTLPSGLQYEVIQEGIGAHPTATNDVVVHYTGKLIDGTVFDSSYDRGEPITLNLGKVIPGWSEGVQLMRPGAKYILYIPSELGYGARGAGADIPPNSVLIFEVELLEIK